MKIEKDRRWIVYLIRWSIIFAFLAVWQLAGASSARQFFFYSTPLAVVKRLMSETAARSLLLDTLATCEEVLLGSIVGLFSGFILGLALWAVRPIGKALQPLIIGLGSIPVFAVAPLLVFWFGVGLYGKVAVVSLSVVFISILATFQAATQIEEDYRELSWSFHATRLEVFTQLILKGSLFIASSSYRLALLFGFIGAFVAEMISSDKGLGHFIQQCSGLYDVTGALAGLTVFVLCALLFSTSLNRLDRSLANWR